VPLVDEVRPSSPLPVAGITSALGAAAAAAAAPSPPEAHPVLGYRARRDDADERRVRRSRRGRRRRRARRGRVSKSGVIGLAAACVLAVWAVASLGMVASRQLGRGIGPAGTVCVTFPLTYLAAMCGIVGVIPRGQDRAHGWWALALTGASWIVYAISYAVVASR
jgi:hypothetical protein